MAKIIETNIVFNEFGEQNDFQSRVIEVDSWEEYVKEFEEGVSITRTSYFGNMHGESLPRYHKKINFKFDEYHLTYDFYNGVGKKMRRLAYLIR